MPMARRFQHAPCGARFIALLAMRNFHVSMWTAAEATRIGFGLLVRYVVSVPFGVENNAIEDDRARTKLSKLSR